MKNKEIRLQAKNNNIPLWKIAEAFGVTDSTFSKWLRKELPQEKKYKALEVIASLSKK